MTIAAAAALWAVLAGWAVICYRRDRDKEPVDFEDTIW